MHRNSLELDLKREIVEVEQLEKRVTALNEEVAQLSKQRAGLREFLDANAPSKTQASSLQAASSDGKDEKEEVPSKALEKPAAGTGSRSSASGDAAHEEEQKDEAAAATDEAHGLISDKEEDTEESLASIVIRM